MTVAEVNAVLYKPGHPADRLARALRIPALSTGWRDVQRTAGTGTEPMRDDWQRGAWPDSRPNAGMGGVSPAAGNWQDPREQQRDLASA
jgi:hypothetical protein